MIAACVACAPRGNRFEQDCSQCHDPNKRKEWGCDEPTAEPFAFIDPCPFCDGGSADCVHCKGGGRIPMHRCPNVLATRREFDAITAAALVEHGVLPDEGGWQDQPNTFVRAYPLLMQEIQHWRAVHQRLAQQKATRK